MSACQECLEAADGKPIAPPVVDAAGLAHFIFVGVAQALPLWR